MLQIFDHRGCSRAPKEYTGKRANGAEDEMMVKVRLPFRGVEDEGAGISHQIRETGRRENRVTGPLARDE